jgi:ubiquinone/menaquinone biosynthesis C-methylase UbiE
MGPRALCIGGKELMDFFDFKNIAERYMEIVNPMVPEKLIKAGKILGLKEGSKVIDFGCGYGEMLALWAGEHGISGVGIEVRKPVCERAVKKMVQRGFSDRIEIICGKGAEYEFEEGSYDVATCIGATFVFNGYQNSLQAMKKAIHDKGKIAIGEPYWLKTPIPEEYIKKLGFNAHLEHELIQIGRDEGFDTEYVFRSSHDDWDRYESDNWYGLVRWLEENPDHPERDEVIKNLHESQDVYLKYGREYMGWAIYIMSRATY